MSLQDLTLKGNKKESGAKGMTAEQVIRAAIIKQMEGYSYEELAFPIIDSSCYRNFCKIGIGQKEFKKSALCNNIKAISSRKLLNGVSCSVDQSKHSIYGWDTN